MQLNSWGRLMTITRQHNETEFPELAGKYCERILGVGTDITDEFSIFFIVISGIMYKFFIDEGVLFWDKCLQDPEEDLDEGERYVDILPSFRLNSANVVKIEMKNKKLLVQLDKGTILFEDNDGSTIVKCL